VKVEEWTQRLHEELEARLQPLGFVAEGNLHFLRRQEDHTAVLRFDARPEGKCLKVAGSAGIRINAVEELLHPVDETSLTLACPFHLLPERRRFFEWEMGSAEQAPELAETIRAEVDVYAVPFLATFCKSAPLVRSLKSNSAHDWFGLSPEQRLCLLPVFDHLAGCTPEAILHLELALASRKKDPPEKREPLENALRKIRQAPCVDSPA
jgi:hypothetical protein